MKTYVRGLSLLAALVLTLTACGGGGGAKGAAARLPGGNNAPNAAHRPLRPGETVGRPPSAVKARCVGAGP